MCFLEGFDDGFRLLERLSLYVFDLPVNLAVKQFQVRKDLTYIYIYICRSLLLTYIFTFFHI